MDSYQTLDFSISVNQRYLGPVGNGELHREFWSDHLHRLAINESECGTERLVPRDHVGKGVFQGAQVQVAGQPKCCVTL